MTSTTDTPLSSHDPLTYAVIVGSVRKQRMGRMVADAVTPLLSEGVIVDLIDLAENPMPDDELLQPGGGEPRSPIAERIEAADGFVVITPEYNHGYPASLKRAIDWHYAEWMFKPATVISYGVQGGVLAAEQLRGVFAELSMVTTRRTIGIRAPWEELSDTGWIPSAGVGDAVKAAFGELAWWTETLRTARRERPYDG